MTDHTSPVCLTAALWDLLNRWAAREEASRTAPDGWGQTPGGIVELNTLQACRSELSALLDAQETHFGPDARPASDYIDMFSGESAQQPLALADLPAHVNELLKRAASPFLLGDPARKRPGGGEWRGRVVGIYLASKTPLGFAVESVREEGSVQIYPARALEKWEERE